jgi:Fe-S-cluster-containing hydrogenase component 2
MLVNHPDECIDCGVCVPECPVDAIEKWLSLNAEYAKILPKYYVQKSALSSGGGEAGQTPILLTKSRRLIEAESARAVALMRATVDTRGKQYDRSSCWQNLYSLSRGNSSTHARAS